MVPILVGHPVRIEDGEDCSRGDRDQGGGRDRGDYCELKP